MIVPPPAALDDRLALPLHAGLDVIDVPERLRVGRQRDRDWLSKERIADNEKGQRQQLKKIKPQPQHL